MAVWTTPTTRSTGNLVTAAIWNTDIVENLKYLKDSPVFDGDISVGDDLFLTSTGAVINFASGDVTITHSTNTLTWAGASSGYIFNDGNLFVRSSATTGSNAWGTGQIKAEQDAFTGISCVTHDNTDGNAGFMQILRSRGTQASPTAVTSTQFIGAYNWSAYDGVNAAYRTVAEIQAYVDGTVSSGIVPGSIRLATANSSGTLVERLRVISGGNIAIGATARFYLDGVAGTGNTYQEESAADVYALVVGGTTKIRAAQTGISVTTSATTIIADAGGLGSFVVVNGNDGSNRFCDLVLASTATAPTVVSSYTALGSPAARTYTRSGDALQLALASGTYAVHTMKFGS